MKKILLSMLIAVLFSATACAQKSDFFQATLVRICTFGPDKKMLDYREQPNSTVFEVNIENSYIKTHMNDGSESTVYLYDAHHDEGSPSFMFFGRDAADNALINYCLNWEDKTMFVMMNDDGTTGYLFYWKKNWRE